MFQHFGNLSWHNSKSINIYTRNSQINRRTFQVIESMDDGLTRPTCNTSPTVQGIYILKNSNPISKVWSINTKFLFHKLKCENWHQPRKVMGSSIFIDTFSLSNCQATLKSNPNTNEMDVISHKMSNQYFKHESSNQTFFKGDFVFLTHSLDIS